MSRRIHFLFLLATLAASTAAWAQRPVYRRAPTEEQHSKVGFSTRILFGAKMTMSNLGSVDYRPTTVADDGTITYEFSDGSVTFNPNEQDYAQDFKFDADTFDYAPTGLNGNQQLITEFTLTNYRSESDGANVEADASGHYGWEVTYEYQWGKSTDRVRFGFIAGWALQNLDFNYFGTDPYTIYEKEVAFSTEDGSLTKAIVYDPTASTYTIAGGNGAEIDFTLVDFDPPEHFFEGDAEGTVDSDLSYNGVMAMFRIGPTIDLRIVRNLNLELSAGLLGIYLYSRMDKAETLYNIPTLKTYTESFQEEESDFLYGYFAEGMLRYQMTPRVGFFGSMMYFKVQDVGDMKIGEVTYNLTLNSPVLASAGMLLTF